MSRTVSLTVVLLLVVAVSPWSFFAGADEEKSVDQSDKGPVTTTTPAENDDTGTTARRIRLDRAVEDAIRQKLLKRVSLNIDERPIGTVLTDLAKKHSLPFVVDVVTLSDEGVALDTTVSLHVEDITLKSTLNLLLRPMQLQTVILDEVMTVTTIARAGEIMETRVYDVAPLVPERDFTELIELITSCVDPESWDESGGPSSVREHDQSRSLIISLPERMHELVAQLLSDLEAATASPPRKITPGLIRDREEAIRRKLVEPCSVKCDGVPLQQALADLENSHSIPLWTDSSALADEGISFEQAVTIDLKGIRIESALNHLLRPHELAWVIDDEVIKVTTKSQSRDHLTARVYDVTDLAKRNEPVWPPDANWLMFGGRVHGAAGGSAFGTSSGTGGAGGGIFAIPQKILHQGFGEQFDKNAGGVGGAIDNTRWLPRGFDMLEVIEAVKSNVSPNSWDDVGGRGTIREFRNTLVIRQTDEVHAQVESLFHRLRDIVRQHAEGPAKPEELKRVVYDLAPYPYPLDELAKLIPEEISPESWKSAGGKGTLHLQPSALVVTQTPANHKEIVKLLYQVVLHAREN